MSGYQFILYLIPVLVSAIASLVTLWRQGVNHAQTQATLAIQHDQLNSQQDKLIAAVTDAATQRGAQEERESHR